MYHSATYVPMKINHMVSHQISTSTYLQVITISLYSWQAQGDIGRKVERHFKDNT